MWTNLRRHWMILFCAWQEERAKPPEDRLHHETAFLPSVLEITEAPPSPAGRVTAKVLILLFSMAIVWSIVGRVEIFAIAQGRIISSGRVKLIQPLESGVVSRILVKEGQEVEQNELLIELDPADSTADETRLSRDWMESLADTIRLRTLGDGNEDPVKAFRAPSELTPDIAERHRRLLTKQWGEHQSQLKELASERKQQEARLRGIGAEIKKLEMVLPLIRERTKAKDILAKTGSSPRMDFLELEQKRIETEESLASKRHEREEAQAILETLGFKIKQVEAQFYHSIWSQYLEADRKTASLAQELDKARTRKKRGQLCAPEAGTVQQLKVFTEGGVVTPAQELMWIVPKDSLLEVEAMVLNKDVGFVEVGHSAEIKVETFLFTKYGTLAGRVTHLSRDAVEEKSMGLVYPVRIALRHKTMNINGRSLPLTPGLAITAEIATGDRRIIDYLLSPILKARRESLTER
ncbi:MAG: HlyD family type I secretion periplasmic adaptor subunit [Magnetococcales bacterium]|nr:HlyD family type I secretion periplasmic adaptor subunit [Magnetococcales bacterium]